MANKNIISIFIIVFVGISLLVVIPILTLSSGLSNYGKINESLPFYYNGDNASTIEQLNINVDIGNIEIQYIDPPVSYHVKIEVNIEMSGLNLAGKTSSNFFNLIWQNVSSPVNFTMEFLSDTWFESSHMLRKNVSIIVSIRKDIIFDINAILLEGNVDLCVPFGVSINNLLVNVTNGKISYDFEYCTIEGNITGIANTGDIVLNSTNVKYTRNNIWTLLTELGDIKIDIVQYKDLGANVTGKATISTKGDLHLYYMDNKPSVGARFILLRKVGMSFIEDFIGDNTEGFERSFLPEGRGTVYTSYDFPATNCYALSLKSSGMYYGGASSD